MCSEHRRRLAIFAVFTHPPYAGLIATACAFPAAFFVDGRERGDAGLIPVGSTSVNIYVLAIVWIATFWMIRKAARAHLALRLVAGLVATVCAFIVLYAVAITGMFGPPDPTGEYERSFLTFVAVVWIAIFGMICCL